MKDADTNKPWSQQVCKRIVELERRVQDGGTLAATIVVNLKRGSIRSDDDAALLALANRLLDERPAKAVIISNLVFVVVAYRYGLRDDHSYVVGAFKDAGLAIQAAEDHVQHRGGKYACEVLDCDVRDKTDEYDELPRQIAYIESPYFGLLGRGSQCADDTDKDKRLQSARWCMDEMRLPLLLRRVLAWPFNAWRKFSSNKELTD